ncbi:hypothetical protein CPB86DRAFT_811171 [Serendipita vermifera]|nr:hypothetical protein CPB86DRAFT_811171 [Serendipita vermifera]
MLDASVNPAIAVAVPAVPTIEQISTTLLHLRASQYTVVAGFVVYAWDFVLTFPDELSYIWVKSRANLFTKFLFFVNRYGPVIGLLPVLHALNPIRKDPLTVNVLILSHTALFTIVGMIIASLNRTMFYIHAFRSCIGTPEPLNGGLYLTPMVIESLVLILTLLHAVRYHRQRQDLVGSTAAGAILQALYVDGCLYYLIVFSLRLATTLVYYIEANALVLLLPYLEYALTSTITSRWFISLRKTLIQSLAHDDFETCPDFTTHFSGPTIHFGHKSRTHNDGKETQAEAGFFGHATRNPTATEDPERPKSSRLARLAHPILPFPSPRLGTEGHEMRTLPMPPTSARDSHMSWSHASTREVVSVEG